MGDHFYQHSKTHVQEILESSWLKLYSEMKQCLALEGKQLLAYLLYSSLLLNCNSK